MPKYNPKEIEEKWQKEWQEEDIYSFNVDENKPVYSIDNPPSFTSGTLHMGHVLNHVWIDFAARYKRMQGYSVLLPVGYDCHGLPTEMKVEKEFDVSKEDTKEFVKKCDEWTDEAIEKMNEQYKALGYSADWNEYYETRSDEYKRLVQLSLLEFNDIDRIYRDKHPVLWCPECNTALAQAEVDHVSMAGGLWYLEFPIKDSDETITIATTRPEMTPACAAVLIHPEDEEHAHLEGKKVLVPMVDREVPIIADEDVDTDFGTGVVYLCTFGDEMDIKWQQKYDLPIFKIVDEEGRLTDLAGEFAGMKAKEARKKMAKWFKEKGFLKKKEDYQHNVLCHVERSACKAPIELLPKKQWFIKVQDKTDAVKEAADEMDWYPGYMKQKLFNWCDSLDWDWIISRQRTYGTPIPFWFCEDCGKIIEPDKDDLPVDPRIDEAPEETCECGGKIVGAQDVCDCWVDSSITPLKVSRWKENKNYFKKAYPNSMRPQGYEIIRTWAFYTIFRSLLLTDDIPFEEVVVNGMVAGPDGRKMSKSFGNVIPPEEALDEHGTDALRQWALNASLGKDYPFSWKELKYAEKFQEKYWNASYFVDMHLPEEEKEVSKLRPADEWILYRTDEVVEQATGFLDDYEFCRAMKLLRDFFWHEFCDYYLEMVKYRLYNTEDWRKEAAQQTLLNVLKRVTFMLAPFVPHITEEVHEKYLKKFTGLRSVHKASWPEKLDVEAPKGFEEALDVISAVRKFKSDNGLPLNKEIEELAVYSDLQNWEKDFKDTLNAEEIVFSEGEGDLEAGETSVDVSI